MSAHIEKLSNEVWYISPKLGQNGARRSNEALEGKFGASSCFQMILGAKKSTVHVPKLQVCGNMVQVADQRTLLNQKADHAEMAQPDPEQY